MDERSRLSKAGLDAAQQAEMDRLEVALEKRAIARAGLDTKTYEFYDAEQGTVSIRDTAGGVAAVSSQGSMSNAAISQGEPVSPYSSGSGVKIVDWSPTIIEPRIILPIDVSARPVDGGGGLEDGDGDGGDEGDGDGDKCTEQLLCYRGVPHTGSGVLGPPAGRDPETWDSITSSNAPIKYTAQTDSDRTLIIATDASGELARLDFKPGQYQIKIACKEDGCDTEPSCETHRLWFRSRGEESVPDATFTWQMRAGPMSASYPQNIQSIASTGGFWNAAGPFQRRPCPMPISFSGNTIYHQFDGVGQYGDNSGACTYIVSFLPVPGDFGPWQSGPLSFAPPLQTSVTVGDDGTHQVTIYDAVTSPSEALAVLNFPNENYQITTRCDGDGAPPA